MVRLSTLTPITHPGYPKNNLEEIIVGVTELADSDIIVTPELSITGYSCGDLFTHEHLLKDAWDKLLSLADTFKKTDQLLVVGCPIQINGAIFNCAVVLNQGTVIGIIPKQFIPNYKEFYEGRHFAPGHINKSPSAYIYGRNYPFGTDLLFRSGKIIVGIEICEDLWVPTPPSSFMAVAGANVILNLSASNEVVGKADYRIDLVRQQSARCIATYAYCSAGPNESTTGMVFSGHNLICENGTVVIESHRFYRERHSQTVDIDIDKINHDRSQTNSFAMCQRMLPHPYRFEEFFLNNTDRHEDLAQFVPAKVFVPKTSTSLDSQCRDVFNIQTCALANRLVKLTTPKIPQKIAIGISGGLDSTLALLVACKTYDLLGWNRKNILGRLLPGFGTSDRTRENALRLAKATGIAFKTIDIRPACIQMFLDLQHLPFGLKIWDHDTDPTPTLFEQAEDLQKQLNTIAKPNMSDLVFENVQARARMNILMNTGFVLGTGNMSELALGWCTYNADQTSMYNVNSGVPKTLVKPLIKWIIDNKSETLDDCELNILTGNNSLYCIIEDICNTDITPELLPLIKGTVSQKTEDVLGPYELHDFFLFHFVRNGFSPEKIAYLAENAVGFSRKYKFEEIVAALQIFINRFFSQQYKRQSVPDGPKIGSVDLNPRGDWRMPSDITPDLWTKFKK